MARPVLFCSAAGWRSVEADVTAAMGPPEDALDLVVMAPGETVADADVARIELAFFSPDLYPGGTAAFLRVCLDAPSLRWLHVFNAGVDHPVFRSFLDRGVRLSTSSGASATPIAQHVVMCLLALARDLPGHQRDQAARRWDQREVDDLEGRTVGIVGMGPIGTETARLALALGMRPIGMRRTVTGGEPCETWTFDRFGELLRVVDDLVLAVPLTADTRRLVGAAELASMRPGARLVNVGRGELVDESALVEALRGGRLGGAALDVFETEPLPEASPLWGLPNVIVTPHSSGRTALSDRRACALFVEHLGAWLRGEPLRNEVRA